MNKQLDIIAQLRWMTPFAILLFIIIYLAPLGSRPLFMPDETRYGEIAREMIATNDWIVPRLNNIRYFEKPVMGHWLNAVSLSLFGETEFAVRFPTALLTGLTGVFVFIMAGRRSRSAGAIAAVIYLTFMMVYALGNIALLDAILTFFLTAALSFFFLYSEAYTRPKRWLYLVCFGLCCGCAFLTKGFLAFAIPVIVAVPYMLLQKRVKDLFLQLPWIPILTAICVISPWALMVHRAEPDFWYYFFWVEHIQRFTGASAGQHPQPFWFYLPVILIGAFPWTFMLPVLLKKSVSSMEDRRESQFLWLWLVLPVLFFSISSGKLITYVLPCFAPLAILLGQKIITEQDTAQKWVWRGIILQMFFFGIGGLILFLTGVYGDSILPYEAEEQGKYYLFFMTLVVVGCILFAALKNKKGNNLIIAVIAWSCLLLSVNFLIPDNIIRSKAPGEFLLSMKNRVTEDSIIVSYDDPMREVCWYYNRDDVYFFATPGEVHYGISYEDAKNRLIMRHERNEPLDLSAFNRFVADWNTKGKKVILIAPDYVYEPYRKLNAIPVPDQIESNGRYVFAEFIP